MAQPRTEIGIPQNVLETILAAHPCLTPTVLALRELAGKEPINDCEKEIADAIMNSSPGKLTSLEVISLGHCAAGRKYGQSQQAEAGSVKSAAKSAALKANAQQPRPGARGKRGPRVKLAAVEAK